MNGTRSVVSRPFRAGQSFLFCPRNAARAPLSAPITEFAIPPRMSPRASAAHRVALASPATPPDNAGRSPIFSNYSVGRTPGKICSLKFLEEDLYVMLPMARISVLALTIATAIWFAGCTQESQNQLGRSIQNWTGTDGVLDVFAGEKIAMRIIKIDKLTTAEGTNDHVPRAYRWRCLPASGLETPQARHGSQVE